MDEAEARRRDRILRTYLLARDWDRDRERRLCRVLAERSHNLLPEHPYIVGYEWEAFSDDVNGDRGDLLFVDGRGRFAVVEVKQVDGANKRNDARRKVEEQAQKFARVVQGLYPGAQVSAWVFTDDRDARHIGREGLRLAEKPMEGW